jgi:hypothetical protein
VAKLQTPGKSRDRRAITRRTWMSTAGASTMLAAAPANLGAVDRLRLTLACGDYDRTRPLMDGRVQVDGTDLT